MEEFIPSKLPKIEDPAVKRYRQDLRKNIPNDPAKNEYVPSADELKRLQDLRKGVSSENND